MKPSALVFALPLLVVAACADLDPVAEVHGPEATLASATTCDLGVSLADAYAELAALRDEVDALESSGALNSGQANALRNHLDNVRSHLDAGRACPAQAQLRAFRRQVGNFVTSGALEPGEAESLLNGADRVLGNRPPIIWSTISVGSMHACGLTDTGEAYCWGSNTRGQLGDGTITERLLPTAVIGARRFASITAGSSSTCALEADGTAWCWGSNGFGELGDGTGDTGGIGEDRYVPTEVVGGHIFAGLSVGSNTACGVRTDDAAYCWGMNSRGQLGDGTTENRAVPVLVAGGLTFVDIAVGHLTTCGVAAGGTYCWGANDRGMIGDGTTGAGTGSEDWHVPTLVSGGHTFTAISVGLYAVCAVSTVDAAWCWGSNERSTIGDGTAVDRTAPTAVSGGHAFASVSTGGGTSCGVTTDAAAWCWGANGFGQIGDGTAGAGDGSGIADRNEPSAVVGGHHFASISVGLFTTCGVRTDGGGYCWGRNSFGTVGDGTTTHRSSPTLVGAGMSLP